VIKEELKPKKTLMGSKERRLTYSIALNFEVVKYVEKHGNRVGERSFGSPPTEKMIRELKKQKKKKK
jgi:hypothetical protein